jgi:hypothetical protein
MTHRRQKELAKRAAPLVRRIFALRGYGKLMCTFHLFRHLPQVTVCDGILLQTGDADERFCFARFGQE